MLSFHTFENRLIAIDANVFLVLAVVLFSFRQAGAVKYGLFAAIAFNVVHQNRHTFIPPYPPAVFTLV